MKAYHITKWDDLYETHETRKIRTLTFYAKPNKLIGEGIGLTLEQPDNVALLGTWALIEALASTSERSWRGWLVRTGTALTAARMAALTRVDAKHFDRALEWFARTEIGWLEKKEVPGSAPGDSPGNLPPTDDAPGDSPGNLPPTDDAPGDSPGNLPPKNHPEESAGRISPRGKREGRGRIGEEGRETATPGAAHVPLLPDVRTWATGAGVDPDFAQLKFEQATERGDFAKPVWRDKWRSKFLRFWSEDGKAWREKSQKNAAPAAGRPDGWMDGDAANWWTDSLGDLKATAAGAVSLGDKKTAGRLRAIIERREK